MANPAPCCRQPHLRFSSVCLLMRFLPLCCTSRASVAAVEDSPVHLSPSSASVQSEPADCDPSSALSASQRAPTASTPAPMSAAARPRKLRGGRRATVYSPAVQLEAGWKPPVIPKDEAAKARYVELSAKRLAMAGTPVDSAWSHFSRAAKLGDPLPCTYTSMTLVHLLCVYT